MKNHTRSLFCAPALLAILILNLQLANAFAQGTAFTYQGQLQNNGSLASGTYNLQFTLYTNATSGSSVAGPVTSSAVAVANGLFTVTIDFGSSVWNGATNWLQIGVESNGIGGFTPLTPRQPLTPVPYAIFAEGASATGISGTIPAGNLSGTYSNPVNLNNANNSFSGSGAGLNSVNAATLNGFIAASFWKTTGNSGTTSRPEFCRDVGQPAVGTASGWPAGVTFGTKLQPRAQCDRRFIGELHGVGRSRLRDCRRWNRELCRI